MTQAWIRTGMAAFAVVYVALAVRVYLSQPAPAGSTLTQAQTPLRWAPRQPVVWEQVGRQRLFDPAGADPVQAEAAFLAAARGNPMEPAVWTGLADTYIQIGNLAKAEAALRTALQVFPRGSAIAWRLANSLVLAGRTAEALPLLQVVALSDPSQARAVYSLGWKLLESRELVLQAVVPRELDARAGYLAFLLDLRRQDVTSNIWQELRRGQHPDTAALGSRLVETLLETSREQEASQIWDDVLADSGRNAARPAGVLMTNGDFEYEMPGTGLDWHLQKDPHWTFTLDNFAACSRSRSLMISFDGKSNPGFDALWQWAVVEPNQDYQLRACIRTDNVTSDSGFQLVVASFTPAQEAFTVAGPAHLGSEPWIEDTLRFRTGPDTRGVRVWLHRETSRKLYGQLSGKVWVDNFRIELVRATSGTGK